MNKKEKVELIFETLSKISGFEIKPNKEFYITTNGKKVKYHIDRDLMLWHRENKGYFENSILQYHQLLTDDYQLEEIKESLTTEEERGFLRNFNFDELEVSTHLNMYNKYGILVTAIYLDTIDFNFDGLEKGRKYSGKELGLWEKKKVLKSPS